MGVLGVGLSFKPFKMVGVRRPWQVYCDFFYKKVQGCGAVVFGSPSKASFLGVQDIVPRCGTPRSSVPEKYPVQNVFSTG